MLRLLLVAAADTSNDVTQQLLASALPAVLEWIDSGGSDLLVSQLLPQASTTPCTHKPLVAACHACFAPRACACHGLTPSPPCPPQVLLQLLRLLGPGTRRSAATLSQACSLLQVVEAALPALASYALRTQPTGAAAPTDDDTAPAGESSAAAEDLQPCSSSNSSLGTRLGPAVAGWVDAGQPDEWRALHFLGGTAVPALVQATLLLEPVPGVIQ